MTRTSKALRRFGVPGLAAATVLAGGAPFFGTQAAFAVTGERKLTAVDCTRQAQATTTTVDPTTAASGSGCRTQAQVGTNKTLTFQLTQEDASGEQQPVSGATIDFALTEAGGAVAGSANFPNEQPRPGTTNSQPGGQTAACTTDAAGQCRVNVTDSEVEDVTVTATDRSPDILGNRATANEIVEFRTDSVDPAALVETARVVVEPASDTYNANSYTSQAGTPGRPIQVTYQVRDVNGDPLRGQTVTLSVDQAAFFTPNCTPQTSGTPNRDAGTGTLVAPSYTACSFTPAPAAGAQAGALTNSGKSITATTGDDGQVTVTVAEGRDAEFDDNGSVRVTVTATAADVTDALTAENGGGSAAPLYFISVNALNGSSVEIVSLPNQDYNLAATSTVNIPNDVTTYFQVLLRDQFGNLTRAATGTYPNRDSARLVKNGAGRVYMPNGPFDCCWGDVTNNGNTQTFAIGGSFTGQNNNGDEPDFISDQFEYFYTQSYDYNSSDIENGTQTLTATWNAPRSTYTFSGTPSRFTSVDQTKSAALTDTATINYYEQDPRNITFTTTPGSNVQTGTVVTVTATVLDQFGNPVDNQPVSFFRSGNSNNCTNTATNQTGQNFATQTNGAGKAGFSFSCSDPSTQNVTVIVYSDDNSGTELARNTQTITFNGPAPTGSASPSATATASTSPSASASQSTSPSASASASQSTSPAPSCTPAQQNLRIKYLVTQGKVGNGQVGPVANATQLVTVQIDGATPGGTVVLEAYQQNHFGTATFANSGNLRTAVADSAGVAKIDVRFSSNARTRARMQGCTFSTASNNNSGYSQGSGANGNVLYVKTVLTFTVTRVNVNTLRISGDSLPARPGGLIVNIDCKDAKCRAGVNQNGNNPNGILLQPRANPTNGEFGPVEYTFKTFKAGERVTLYATTGDPDTGKGDAQNIAGRSNDRSVVFVR